jgi:hypothetical protein
MVLTVALTAAAPHKQPIGLAAAPNGGKIKGLELWLSQKMVSMRAVQSRPGRVPARPIR